MKLLYPLLMTFLILSISGCSSKSIQSPQEASLTIQNGSSEESELDEFAEELEVKEIYDPLSGYNRMMTSFNDGAYEYVFQPIAKGYKAVVHEEIRESVGNFFDNIYYPIRFVNNLLQGKVKNATEETGRFIVNSTIGILGLFDPAKSWFDLEAHEEDFGQTLGFYGVGSGPHIVLPFLGPSNLRDAFSLYPDSFVNTIDYTKRSYWETLTDTPAEYLAARSYEEINFISLDIEAYDKLKEDAVDLYPYLRDIYEQYRDNKIKE